LFLRHSIPSLVVYTVLLFSFQEGWVWSADPEAAPEPQANPPELHSQGNVEAFYGAYVLSIPIRVPTLHGIEPSLALTYHSQGNESYIRPGWNLTGISVIERTGTRRSVPRYDGSDNYLLDGEELI